ncbi:MAG: DUF4397 domain-containing protein [Candidatus Eisenbacteria bacterium]
MNASTHASPRSWRSFLPVVFALPLLFGLAACSDDDDDNGFKPNVGETNLRALHLSPDAPAVDVFLNNGAAAAVSDLSFSEGTGYLTIPEGTYEIDVAANGQTANDAVLSVPGLSLEKDLYYTAVAYNTLSGIAALALVDNYTGLAAGNIRVRAIHTAAGVGQVDIWNVTNPGSPGVLYADVDFSEVGAYLDLPAAAYTLGFDVNNDAVPDLNFAIPALPAGTVANVFAVRASNGDVFLLAQLQSGATVRIDPL